MHWVISVIALVCGGVVVVLVIIGLLSVVRKSARFVGRTAVSVGNLLNGADVAPPPPRARRRAAPPETLTDDASEPTP